MNKLKGKIVDIQSSDNISIVHVDVDGDILSSIVLEGKKSPSNYKINRFKATIKKIDKGPVLAKITLIYRDHIIESIISSQSAVGMKLKVKEEVEWLVKTNEVTLMRNPA